MRDQETSSKPTATVIPWSGRGYVAPRGGVSYTGGGAYMADPLLMEWMLWQNAAKLSDNTINERIRVLAQFHVENPTGAFSATPVDIIRWMGRHSEWSASTAATYHSYLRAWFHWLTVMDYRADNPMVKIASPKYPERVTYTITEDFGTISTPLELASHVVQVSNRRGETRSPMFVVADDQGRVVRAASKTQPWRDVA